jgi:hypothetical protein
MIKYVKNVSIGAKSQKAFSEQKFLVTKTESPIKILVSILPVRVKTRPDVKHAVLTQKTKKGMSNYA